MADKCSIEGCNNVCTSRGYGKRRTVCSTHHRQKYPQNPARLKRRSRQNRLRLYNLTKESYAALIDGQNNCCAICGKKLDKPYIDHCHSSSKVRGALCGKCNWGIGMFDEDLNLLASAASYLINSRLKETG